MKVKPNLRKTRWKRAKTWNHRKIKEQFSNDVFRKLENSRYGLIMKSISEQTKHSKSSTIPWMTLRPTENPTKRIENLRPPHQSSHRKPIPKIPHRKPQNPKQRPPSLPRQNLISALPRSPNQTRQTPNPPIPIPQQIPKTQPVHSRRPLQPHPSKEIPRWLQHLGLKTRQGLHYHQTRTNELDHARYRHALKGIQALQTQWGAQPVFRTLENFVSWKWWDKFTKFMNCACGDQRVLRVEKSAGVGEV